MSGQIYLQSNSRTMPNRQSGVVLLLALIILVAMTLAGIGMMRSVDSGILIAGNLAFKQTTLQATDNGYRAAMAQLNAVNNATPATLEADAAFTGYRSSTCDMTGAPTPCATTWWTTNAGWTGAPSVTLGNGVTIEYWVDRMCPATGAANANSCVMDSVNLDKTGNSPFFVEYVFYRITTRSTGPRNSASYTQSLVKIQKI